MINGKKENLICTKARTLNTLKPILKKSKIEDLFYFNFANWKNNLEKILDNIQDSFGKRLIVIRSSSINEDTETKSNAGQFESILNINPLNRKSIKEAVNKVFESYKNQKQENSFNQVLIQVQTRNILVSGVVFTRSLNHNSPYYVINYDDATGLSDSVTSGSITKTIKILKPRWKKNTPNKFKRLLFAIREIEKKFPNKGLDIEFAINKKEEVIIFQVRPITVKEPSKDIEILKRIQELQKKYFLLTKNNSRVNGERKIFADMPDWNPAEILGDNPGYLDYSLYDYIITKDPWHKARISQGYDAGKPSRLVYLFGNKPYVDAGVSFSSFIPLGLSKNLRDKLILFYLEKLRKNPHLQDKVEFEILYTCYDLTFNEISKELLEEGFSSSEVNELKKALINLTNNLVLDSKHSIKKDMNSLEEMKENRLKKKIKKTKDPTRDLLILSKDLLDGCKNHGTVQFSRLARLAFIGKIILKSLLNKKVINKDLYDSFMESITTVSTEFERDFRLLKKRAISKEKFIKKYYHLRPGTYDITSKRYESNIKLLKTSGQEEIKKEQNKKFKLPKEIEKDIDTPLKNEGLNFSARDLFKFIKDSLEAREKSKFEFTKNLSDAIELIAITGQELGFTREELSFLGVEELFFDFEDNKQLINFWQKTIANRRKLKAINNKLELPPIIDKAKSFEVIRYYSPKPNYITQKKVISKLIVLDKEIPDVSQIENKIVLLENGDPGYDWIFTRNPAGLITKYGGVASHMSIRCAEFGLPAAIGCGILFDLIKDKEKVILDCNLKKITPLVIK